METLPARIAVLGLGRSGLAVARYLASERDLGTELTILVVDEGTGPDVEARAASLVSECGVRVTVGASSLEGEWDLVVASPGIPPASPLMRSALSRGVPVISEIEFASRRAVSPFIAVTGTNGKTTTTALIAHLLDVGGIPAEAVGNIGTPAISAVGQVGRASLLVAEVSSFQLALTVTFRPRIAVLLNITPDHIDWHGSVGSYVRDKVKVFANMGAGDTAVIDMDDAGAAVWAAAVEGRGVRVVRVSRETRYPGGAFLDGGVLTLDGPDGLIPLLPGSELGIRGTHNVSNALAAAAAAHAAGVAPSALREGLAEFRPIEHRLEPAGEVGGVAYCNDSKATNPDAVLKALTAFADQPIILLLGGRNKGSDFGPLAEAVAGRCRSVVLFGEALPELREAFSRHGMTTLESPSMVGAVGLASSSAVPGDTILLSPGCASFDEFRSYEHRGVAFKSIVAAIADAAGGFDEGRDAR